MEIIYLDQFVPSKIRRPKPNESCHFKELYRALKRVASTGIAIAPFSDCHIAESRKISDEEHREWLADFWLNVGGGMRYIPSLGIQQQQIESLIDRTPIRFWANRVVMKSPLRFDQYLEAQSAERNSEISSAFREVVSYWKTLPRKEMDKKIRNVELNAPIKLIASMFAGWLRGEPLTLQEVNSRHNQLLTIVLEKLQEARTDQLSIDEALAWMTQNLANVPSLYLEACCLESKAEQYAMGEMGSVDKSKLDHDAYDFEAFSLYLPYSYSGIFDNKAMPKFDSACRKAGMNVPKYYAERDMENFIRSIDALRAPEAFNHSLETEQHLFCILVIPCRGNPLIKRRQLDGHKGINQEILPNGGIKQWQEHTDFSESLIHLKSAFERFPDETEALLPADIFISHRDTLRYSNRIEFGSWEIDELITDQISNLGR